MNLLVKGRSRSGSSLAQAEQGQEPVPQQREDGSEVEGRGHWTRNWHAGSSGESLQLGHRSVERILITREDAGVRVLPDRLVAPTCGHEAGGAVVAGQEQRVVRAKAGVGAGALVPPVRGGVDGRKAAGESLHGIG